MLIEIANLSKTFGRTAAVKRFNLRIEGPLMRGVIGP